MQIFLLCLNEIYLCISILEFKYDDEEGTYRVSYEKFMYFYIRI